MPFEYGNNGYIGTWLCGEDGVFSTAPTVSLVFSKIFSGLIPGLTITWSTRYGEWALKFSVVAYHGENIVFNKIFENHSLTTVINGDIKGYNKIEIKVLKWCRPLRRARIERVLLGIEKIYDKKDLMSYSASMEVDPLSASLPKSEITFELKNLNGEFSRDNPQGIEKYLIERQTVTARYGYKLGGDVEWIPGGRYFLSEWTAPQNGITASFTARDSLEFMTDTYEGPNTGTLLQIATAAFEQANLPKMADGSESWYIPQSLSQISVPGGEDLSKLSIAVVLQYVANAGCCVLFQDRSGKFHMEQFDPSITDYSIDRFNSYADAEIARSKQLKSVNVNNGQFILNVGEAGETQPISNPLISNDQAQKVAAWAADYLQNRRKMSGNYRADPRLDPLDIVQNETRFYTSPVLITSVKYSYNGAFRGSYEGRGLESAMSVFLYSGEPLAISGIAFPSLEG